MAFVDLVRRKTDLGRVTQVQMGPAWWDSAGWFDKAAGLNNEGGGLTQAMTGPRLSLVLAAAPSLGGDFKLRGGEKIETWQLKEMVGRGPTPCRYGT